MSASLEEMTQIFITGDSNSSRWCSLVYWGLTPQQQPGSCQGGQMMIMKPVELLATVLWGKG